MEDKGNLSFKNLGEVNPKKPSEVLDLIEFGFSVRQTHSTTNNDTSSRSHAICRIILRDESGKEKGKLILVDLAVFSILYKG